ncbi:hypothetical protein SAMN04489765_3846 [Tsukamurella pulmonis]|uniref:Uncharacterized protein n=1 Tax=Tsukamurella pulmonis TaxID=47312 RepID=A0A1H1H602_9ACTN|nr:hypothetical protein [Tsukamurella pulmonis]SDR20880.1 hypothetical protein SAMN04489765_3846 [Tsukamurella pulmonis]SUP15852.1 Uncharacterised protein [Tsukamurella pulmonis]
MTNPTTEQDPYGDTCRTCERAALAVRMKQANPFATPPGGEPPVTLYQPVSIEPMLDGSERATYRCPAGHEWFTSYQAA